MDRGWESNRTILQRVARELHELRHEVRAMRRDEHREDQKMARTMEDVLTKIREAKTVSESTNIGVREVKRMLKEAQQANDPAKFDEAIALLDAMAADDAAVLTENTPDQPPVEEPPFNPSGN